MRHCFYTIIYHYLLDLYLCTSQINMSAQLHSYVSYICLLPIDSTRYNATINLPLPETRILCGFDHFDQYGFDLPFAGIDYEALFLSDHLKFP